MNQALGECNLQLETMSHSKTLSELGDEISCFVKGFWRPYFDMDVLESFE